MSMNLSSLKSECMEEYLIQASSDFLSDLVYSKQKDLSNYFISHPVGKISNLKKVLFGLLSDKSDMYSKESLNHYYYLIFNMGIFYSDFVNDTYYLSPLARNYSSKNFQEKIDSYENISSSLALVGFDDPVDLRRYNSYLTDIPNDYEKPFLYNKEGSIAKFFNDSY